MQLPGATQRPPVSHPLLTFNFSIGRTKNNSHAKENPSFLEFLPGVGTPAGCVRVLSPQPWCSPSPAAPEPLTLAQSWAMLNEGENPARGTQHRARRGAGSGSNNTSLPNGKRFLQRPPRVPPAHSPCTDIGPILESRFPRHDGCSLQQFCSLPEQRNGASCRELCALKMNGKLLGARACRSSVWD